MSAGRPPRIAQALLRRVLHPLDRSPMLGDLEEEHRQIAASRDRRSADRWYWIQTGRAIGPSVRRRLGSRGSLGGSMGRELRQAARALRRRPGLSLVAVATLGLGIGSTTAIYSLVDAVLLRPLPYPNGERLVTIWNTYDSWRDHDVLSAYWDKISLSWPEYEDLLGADTSFEELAVYGTFQAVLTGSGDPAVLTVGVASAPLFGMLGVDPYLGRSFTEVEVGRGAPRLAVLSFEIWRDRFGEDPDVLGRTVTLDDVPFTVVGVLPPGFRLPALDGPAGSTTTQAIWVPVGATGGELGRGEHYFEALGLLSEGTTVEAVTAQVVPILRGGRPAEVRGARLLFRKDAEVGAARRPLLLLLGAVGLLLLIACGNVAALFLADTARRRPELATRSALGAGGARIVRQLTTESLLLGLTGALVGVGVAFLSTDLLVALAPADLQLPASTGVDGSALTVALLLGVVVGVSLGLLPALSLRGWQIGAALRGSRGSETRGGRRFQRGVVAGQLAVSMVLLVSGGLVARSLDRLLSVDPGFRTDGLLTANISLSRGRFATSAAVAGFFRELAAELEAQPGIMAVSTTSAMPFSGRMGSSSFRIVGVEHPEGTKLPEANRRTVMPGFPEMIGLDLVEGRMLNDTDREFDAPVVVVSRSLAELYWPGRSALGEQIRRDRRDFTIVGVVSDVRHSDLTSDLEPTFYVPIDVAERRSDHTLVLRTALPPERTVSALREAITAVDPNVPVQSVTSVQALVERSTQEERFRSLLLVTFALAATVLSAIGLFGVTARAVGARSREMGIRIALGAVRGALIRRVVGGEIATMALGLAVGIGGAVAAGSLLSGMLFGITPADPLAYIAAGLILLAVGTVATAGAARVGMCGDVVAVLEAG